MIRIFILVLNFNGSDSTIELFDSLKKLKVPDGTTIESIIVDNGSRKDHVKKIKKALPNVTLLETHKNLGFTGGNNFGVKYAINKGADYVVILNNDTRVEVNLIENLYETIKSSKKIGGVLPKIYFEKGYEFHKKRYKNSDLGKVIWYAGGVMDWDNLIGHNQGVDKVDRGQYNERGEIGLATGCCFMLRTDLIKKIGMFDDKYFLYYEDADLSQRVKKAGYKIMYEPNAIMWHKNAESSGGVGSSLQDYYIARNRMIFGFSYASIRTKLALVRESFKIIISGRKWQRIGIRDFYMRKFGRGSYPI